MIDNLRRLFHCTRAAGAVEAAIFAPVFLVFTIGISDLGMGIFARMAVNAATQSGAIYAVVNSGPGGVCATLTPACLNGIKAVMNNATNNQSFCTGSVCTASIGACADGAPKCISVTVNYACTPIFLDAAYSWAQSTTISSTASIRTL